MNPSDYFIRPQSPAQKQYCALAAYYKDNIPAEKAAAMYGYKLSAFYSLVRDFKKRLERKTADPFFKSRTAGRPIRDDANRVEAHILSLRRADLSTVQIVRALRERGIAVSQAHVWRILETNGVSRLKRRTRKEIDAAERDLDHICDTGSVSGAESTPAAVS
jgi:transposase